MVKTSIGEACMHSSKTCMGLNDDGGPWRRRWRLLAALSEAMTAYGGAWCRRRHGVGRRATRGRRKVGENVHEEDVPKWHRFDFFYNASKCYLHPDLCCLYLPGSLELLMCPQVYLHTPQLHKHTPKHSDLRFYPPHLRIDHLVPQFQLTPSQFLNAPLSLKITTLTLSFL